MEMVKTKITLPDGTKKKYEGNAVLGVSICGDDLRCFSQGKISAHEAIEALANLITAVDEGLGCEGDLITSLALAIMINDYLLEDAD